MRILKQSESTASLRRVFFVLVDSATGLVLQTGKVGTLAGFLTRGGATPVALAGTFTEVNASDQPGLYYYEAKISTPNELDTIGRLVFRFTATDCLERTIITHVGVTREGLSSQITTIPTAAAIDTQLSGTHGAGTWEDKAGPGEGANVVTLTVEDDTTSSPVPAVQIQVRNSDETVLLAMQETDVSGEAGFLLDDGTYKVRLRKLGSYAFSNPETLVVSGMTTQTYQGTAFSPSAPPSPETCVLSGTTHDAQTQPVSVEVLAELVESRNFTGSGIQVIKGPVSAWTRIEDGYWEMILTRSVEYIGAAVVYSIHVNGISMGEYLIPDQANVDFADLAPYEP